MTDSIQRSETKTGTCLFAPLEPNRSSLPQRSTAASRCYKSVSRKSSAQTWPCALCLLTRSLLLAVISGLRWHSTAGLAGSALALPTDPLLPFRLLCSKPLRRAHCLWLCPTYKTHRVEEEKVLFEILFQNVLKISLNAPKFQIAWSLFLECDTTETRNRSDKRFKNI